MNFPINSRLGGVFVHVSDMPRAIAFYEQLLGRKIEAIFDEGKIAVIPTDDEGSLVLDANKPEQHHPSDKPIFMFTSDDLEGALAHVVGMGLPLAWNWEDHGHMAFFTVRDPDSNMLMICQTGR